MSENYRKGLKIMADFKEKLEYEKPKIEVIELDIEDVITTSGENGEEGYDGNDGNFPM